MQELIQEGKKRNCDRKVVLFYTAIKIKYFNRLWDKFTSEQKKIFKKWLKEYDIKLEKYLTNTNYDVIIDEICETYDY
jgi:TRAP-type C4-dicarboxylate transport system substrate-binding protein